MNVCVLYNPKSGTSGQLDAIRQALGGLRRVKRVDFRTGDDLGQLARQAAAEGFDVIAVAGGDGTVHAVVNGLGPNFPPIPIAVFPLGTGNDLCRTLAVPLDPADAVRVLRSGRVRALDAIRVGGEFEGFALNAVTGGFSGRVASEITSEMKGFWGPLAYLRGAAGQVVDRTSHKVRLRLDGQPAREFNLLNVVVANGRSAAGGVTVAPLADPEDGLLDVILVPNSDVFDLSIVTARLLEGDYTADERVHHHRAARVEITADPPMTISVDGELMTGHHFKFEVVPKAVRVYAGRHYHHRGRRAGDPVVGVKALAKRAFGLIGAGLFLVTRMPGGYLAAMLVTLACLFGFLSIARGLSGDHWQHANVAAVEFLRGYRAPAVDRIAVGMDWAGHWVTTTMIGVGSALFWLRKRLYLETAMLIAVVVGCGVLEVVLKNFYHVARPEATFDWFPRPDSYSFPSGHALRSVGLFGYLAVVLIAARPVRAWRWLAAGGLVGLALEIAASRVYLGVHTFMDVLAGAFAAGCWVAGCLVIRSYAIRRRRRTRPVTSEGSTFPGE